MRARTIGMVVVSMVLGLSNAASGQCEAEWSDAFTPAFFRGGGDATATLFDDGTGMKLIVSDLSRSGSGEAGLQVWDGQSWSTLALPPQAIGDTQIVRAFNAHVPPRLVVGDIQGGSLVEVFIYENGVWQATGFPTPGGLRFASEIQTGSDPAGEELFISGLFSEDGPDNTLVYHFDGQVWTSTDASGPQGATDLVWFDDGSGLKLYAGVLSQIDGVAAAGVARWDGSTWEEVGGGCPAYWPTLAVYDDGSGPALWALDGEGDELAKWDGVSWTSFPLEPGDAVLSWRLVAAEVGGQSSLFWTDWINGDSRLWRWDGGSGQPVASVGPGVINDLVASGDVALGAGVFAAGDFTRAGGDPAVGVARWSGSAWNALGNEDTGNGAANAFALRAVGAGAGGALGGRVYVGTDAAAGADVSGVAAWDGEQWAAVGPAGMKNVRVGAFELGDIGGGLRLFAGGSVLPDDATGFSIIAWTAAEWAVVGDQIGGSTDALAFGALDGGDPTLYVGGRFEFIDGAPFYSVAALTDGGWAPLGQGLPSSIGVTSVRAMELHDDGTGTALYAGGTFRRLAPELADGIVRWDGQSWSRVGEAFGFGPTVSALLSTDLGGGRRLYAAGGFDGPNGQLQNVAVWDGSAWMPLGDGLPFDVGSLARIETPEGPRLAATAEIYGTEVAERVYVWDGVAWAPFGAETDGVVRAVAQAEHEFGAVYMTGLFTEVDGVPSEGIARYGCATCVADFNGDGVVDTRDVLAFLNAWASGDGAADINGDGVVDTRDVLAFLNLWNAGC